MEVKGVRMKSNSSKLLPAVLFLVAATLVACPTTSTETPVTQGGSTVDTTPPTLISSVPANGAVNITPNSTQVVFNFSEPMNTLSTGPEITCMEQAGKEDSACNNTDSREIKWSDDAKTLTIILGRNVGNASKITFSFPLGSNQDKAGNPIAATSVEFTLADIRAPRLVSSIPVKKALNVPVNTEVSFTFTEAIDPAAFTVNCIGYYAGVKKCDADLAAQLGTATWFGNGRTVVFKLTENLKKNSQYTLIPLGKDLAGNALPDTRAAYDEPTQVTFTTVAE
jgi:Bacterial Ig-like domain